MRPGSLSRLACFLATPLPYATALRLRRRVPPLTVGLPGVIGIDDFALRRRHRYATIIIDAETGQRVDVLPDREAATVEAWLRGKKKVEVVCRDGSATYAEAIRRALPHAVQVSDRWHLWRNLCDKVLAVARAQPPAGQPSTRPVLAASASRPPASAGTKSTPSSARASACSNAPAGSGSP
jgi:transposase